SVAKATLISDHSLCRTAKTMLRLYMILVTGDWAVKVLPYGSGALRPPPPVAAPLVPRYALLPAATPRDVLSARGTPIAPIGLRRNVSIRRVANRCGICDARIGRSPIKRWVGAGRSAQRGTSGATTGPRGARSAPPNPDKALTRSAPPNPDKALARSTPPTRMKSLRYFVRGSATSRNPSPNKLIAKTVAAMHRPGAIICHGYSSKYRAA